MMRTWVLAVQAAFASSLVFAAAFILLIPVIQVAEQKLFPIKLNWLVTYAEEDGQDLLLSGLVTKPRDCTYLPPPIAINKLTNRPLVVVSLSNTPSVSWPPSNIPRPWGPWRIVGGVGKPLSLYQDHRCHVLWDSQVYLGDYPEQD